MVAGLLVASGRNLSSARSTAAGRAVRYTWGAKGGRWGAPARVGGAGMRGFLGKAPGGARPGLADVGRGGGHCAAGNRRGQNELGTDPGYSGGIDGSQETQERLGWETRIVQSQRGILPAPFLYGRHPDQLQGASGLSYPRNC